MACGGLLCGQCYRRLHCVARPCTIVAVNAVRPTIMLCSMGWFARMLQQQEVEPAEACCGSTTVAAALLLKLALLSLCQHALRLPGPVVGCVNRELPASVGGRSTVSCGWCSHRQAVCSVQHMFGPCLAPALVALCVLQHITCRTRQRVAALACHK